MTRKIYYENPYQTEFKAVVVGQKQRDDVWQVELDQTCFYPGGGGQPADSGWLQDIPVLKVHPENGKIYHLLDRRIAGETVEGRIDARRRRDAMQQHSGQHLISACLQKIGDYPTVSVHFGEKTTAIEVDAGDISREKLLEAEELANSIIEKNLKIRAHWASPDELNRFPLRRRPPEKEKIRVIEIEDFDFSACGGTHLSNTGEIRLIKWTRKEKIRNRWRLHFKIGDRALGDYRERVEILRDLSGMLSCSPDEMPAQVAKLQQTLKAQIRELKSIRKENIAYKARQLLNTAEVIRGVRLITVFWQDQAPAYVSGMVQELLTAPPCLVWIVNCQEKQVLWTLAGAGETPLALNDFIQAFLKKFSAKGGGSGSVLRGKLEPPRAGQDFFAQVKEGLLKELKNA